MSSTAEKCSKILPLVPVLLNFFRQSTEILADDLVITNKDHDKDISVLIGSLYRGVTENNLSLTQINFVCTNSGISQKIWPKAITKIISSCALRLINDRICDKLFKEYQNNKSLVTNNNQECGSILGPVLDELPRKNYEVLGTLLAYIRDYSHDFSFVSKHLARSILTSGGSGKSAKELFVIMVDNAEPLFGRVASTRTITVSH